jgi:hypothetical protein
VDKLLICIMRICLWAMAASLFAVQAYGQSSGEIIWENEGFAEGAAIPRNLVVNSGGVQATLSYDTITDGGTQVPAGGFPDFLSYFNQFTFAGENGIALIAYDNSFNDRDDRIIINLEFNQPVFNLDFDLLNFNQTATVDDGVQVFFDDGVGPQQTLLNNPAFFTESGALIIPDNIPGVTGWEGNGDGGFGGTEANLNVNFGAQPVQNVVIEVYVGDDSANNPGGLFAGLGDIRWVDGGADLTTQVTTSSFIPFTGSLVTNTVEITNTGPQATSGVVIDIPLPAGLASDNSSGDYDEVAGLWTIGNLAVGQTAALNIISTVQETGPYVFVAEVQNSNAGDPDSTPGNRLTNPNEDDTDSVTLSPRESNPMLSCNGRLIEVLSFENPTLTSGSANSVGAVYRYDNVTSGISTNVTITGSVGGAGLANIDDDGPFIGNPDNELLIGSFQPVLNTNGDSGIEFQFDFFFTDTGLPATLDFAASSIDVDGNGVDVVEYVDYEDSFVESLFSSTTVLTEINPSPNNANEIRFQSTSFDAAPGVDRSAVDNIVTVFYTDTTTFTATLGATGTFNGRLTSMTFDCPSIGTAVSNPVIDEDFGDAPINNYGNPIHTIVAGIQLGASNTAEATSFDSPTAAGDAGDDGAAPPDFTGGETESFDVDVSGNGGFLQVWIDWNIDGDFDDANENVIADVQDGDGDGVITLAITAPIVMTAGDSFIRLRWSTSSGLSPGEAAGDGEVEDYAISLILGDAALNAVKTVNALNGSYSIPGSDVSYTITVSNTGAGAVDVDSIFLVDNFPDDLEYVFADANGDAAGTDEIIFTEITPTGLTFDPATDVGFSIAATPPTSFADCTDSVDPGVNPDVAFICFNPKGSFLAADPAPSFSITFRARIP